MMLMREYVTLKYYGKFILCGVGSCGGVEFWFGIGEGVCRGKGGMTQIFKVLRLANYSNSI